FSTIVHGHYVAKRDTNIPTDWNFWQNYCKSFILGSSTLYVLEIRGIKDSVGVKAEIQFAIDNKIPIKYIQAYKTKNEEINFSFLEDSDDANIFNKSEFSFRISRDNPF